MNQMKCWIACFCMCLLSARPAFTQTTREKVNHLLEEAMKTQKIPGVQLVVIKDGKIILSVAKGLANVEFSVPVTDTTIFSNNSIAKVFTGVAIMQLMEAGKIDPDQAVGTYLDSLPVNWQAITLKQLLAHISGLPDIEDDFTGGLVGNKGEDTAWKIVQTMPLQFKPGEQFSYNATNYLLLQRIIEKFGHLPFEQYVQQHELAVAGMRKTIFGNSFEVVKGKAPTYTFYQKDKNTGEGTKGQQLNQTYEYFPRSFRADAGVFSTATDMGKWLIALTGGHRLLKRAKSIETMWTPATLNNGKTEGFDELLNGYAMGWLVVDRKEHPAVAAIGGGRAAIMIYPADGLAIILFTNLSGCAPEMIADKLARLYF